MRRIAFLANFPLFFAAFLALATSNQQPATAADLIIPKADKYGQPLATWQDPPLAAWNGKADLPDGSYTLKGIKTDTLRLPMKGQIVIRDSAFKKVWRTRTQQENGTLEVVMVNCTFTESFAVELPQTLQAVALVNCKFTVPDGPRMSYVYINAKGPNYLDGVICSGGHTVDNGQHAVDVGTNDGDFISIRGLVTAGGSTSGVNVHVKPAGLGTLYLSDFTIRDRTGIDCADFNNAKSPKTNTIWARNGDFALQQHPTMQSSMYCLFPAHAVNNFIGIENVNWSGGGGSAMPTDPEFGSIRPAFKGTLPWKADCTKGKTVYSAVTLPDPPATQPTTPATQPTTPTTQPATQPTTPAPATRPASAVIEFTAPDGKVYRFPIPATSN